MLPPNQPIQRAGQQFEFKALNVKGSREDRMPGTFLPSSAPSRVAMDCAG
ncbi:MAG: hypothetical protein WCA12_11925 [Burkholderiales bacterium]